MSRPSGPAPYGGKALAASMSISGMGTADVAKLCGVSVRAVQLWLADERPVPVLAGRVMRGIALGVLSRKALETL